MSCCAQRYVPKLQKRQNLGAEGRKTAVAPKEVSLNCIRWQNLGAEGRKRAVAPKEVSPNCKRE